MADARGEIHVEVAGRSDVGCQRQRNEDYFSVLDLTHTEATGPFDADAGPRGFLFLVCDGMGGHVAGQVASHLAVDMVTERMAEAPPDASAESMARVVRAAARRANARIFRVATENPRLEGMGTTLSAAVLAGSTLVVAQVGDSRAYVLRGTELAQVTRDQSLVEELIRTGQLTEVEAQDFEATNIILQALGVAADVDVALTRVDLRRGDHLLVCSDGLSGVVEDDHIKDAISTAATPDDACKRLIELARESGGPDNITCVVGRFGGEGLAAPTEGEHIAHGPLEVEPGPEDERGRDEGGKLEIPADLLHEEDAAMAGWTRTLPAIDPAALGDAAAPSPAASGQRSLRSLLLGVLAFLVLGGGVVVAWYAFRPR
jgi:protein phosphatase